MSSQASSISTSGDGDPTAPGTSAGATGSSSGAPATTSGETGDASETSASTTFEDPFETVGSDSFTSGFETEGGQDCQTQVDLVFVMDVSTSMGPILAKLESEIATVDAAIKALDLGAPITPRYGLVVFVDDTKLIASGEPLPDVALIQSHFNTWYTFTQGNTQTSGMGLNNDWPENTLDALHQAANEFQWGDIEDTLRLVIHTTDDTFGEKPAVQSGVPIQHTYLETVLLLQTRQIRVFSFADADWTGGPLNNVNVSYGFFEPYNGHTEIPVATDGGAFNINDVLNGDLSLSAAINESVEQSLCKQYIPQ
ncbi:MAG: VWA domain-containing protein [Myxococcales bacterium]|nr:VWA domain-containing protein [Myxococcales bacterium]